jgi:hypothetical protein
MGNQIKKLAFNCLAIFFSITFAVAFVFLTLELFPTLLGNSAWYFPYYAINRDYIVDKNLVFRRRPSRRAFSYYGDQYTEQYGVPPAPIHFEETLNRNGFREDHAALHPEVVVMGDSFIEIGENEQDTFSQRLRKTSGYSTKNYGLAWFGPYQYLEVLRHEVPKSGGRFALFCFFEGNDLVDIKEYRKWKTGGDYYQFKLRPGFHLWDRFRLAINDVGQAIHSHFIEPQAKPESFFKNQLVDLKLKGEHQRVVFHYKPDFRSAVQITDSEEGRDLQKILVDFKRVSAEKDFTPVVVYIPYAAHIYGAYATEKSGSDWRDRRSAILASVSNVEKAVTQMTNRAKLPLINLVNPFKEKAAQGELLYYPFDTHWNPRGREVAAEYVGEKLRRI